MSEQKQTLVFAQLKDTLEIGTVPFTPRNPKGQDDWDYKVRLELAGWEIFNSESLDHRADVMVAKMDFENSVDNLYGKVIYRDGQSATEWFQFKDERDEAFDLDVILQGLTAPKCLDISQAKGASEISRESENGSPFYKKPHSN